MTEDVNALQLLDSEEQTTTDYVCYPFSVLTCGNWSYINV
ncbi:ALQxL family class IV lanthipeptide [Kitasatospora sp. NPDC091207]